MIVGHCQCRDKVAYHVKIPLPARKVKCEIIWILSKVRAKCADEPLNNVEVVVLAGNSRARQNCMSALVSPNVGQASVRGRGIRFRMRFASPGFLSSDPELRGRLSMYALPYPGFKIVPCRD